MIICPRTGMPCSCSAVGFRACSRQAKPDITCRYPGRVRWTCACIGCENYRREVAPTPMPTDPKQRAEDTRTIFVSKVYPTTKREPEPMTVDHLIARLQAYPGDTRVMVRIVHDCIEEVNDVSRINLTVATQEGEPRRTIVDLVVLEHGGL